MRQIEKSVIGRAVGKAADLLRVAVSPVWMRQCPVCGTELKRGETPLCLSCLNSLARIEGPEFVPYMGLPGNMIEVRSWFVYTDDETAHRVIHAIKYHGKPEFARRLGREFAMQKLLDDKQIDVVLPIPLHWTRYVERGYNQSRLMAQGIRDVTGVDVGRNLYARRPHVSQTKGGYVQRASNVKGIFGVRHPERLNGRHIAIFDDVITTGATMYSALDAVLAAAQPASVTLLSAARTRKF